MANSAYQNVFRFTSLRTPKSPNKEQWYLRYSKDIFLSFTDKCVFEDRNVIDKNVSPIGGKIYEDVFCKREKDQKTIVDEVLEFDGFSRKEKLDCNINSSNNGTAYTINSLSNEAEYSFSDKVEQDTFTWFLSHRIDFTERLDLADRIIQAHLVRYDKQLLILQLQKALQVDSLAKFVLNIQQDTDQLTIGVRNSEAFKIVKGQLFDLLYALYISKRRFSVNLDHIIRQIQTLHVIEFLGYDQFSNEFLAQNSPSKCRNILDLFFNLFHSNEKINHNVIKLSSLVRHSLTEKSLNEQMTRGEIDLFTEIGPLSFKSYISSKEDLFAFFKVQPIIHPIFSRLKYYHIPFNDIRPIGIADLKIVKQALIGYEPGEVAHIENVLKGESKERILRRLDTIETFTSDETSSESESTRENQTADRNEMQRETQLSINETLNLNTDASVNYNNVTVNATLNAGFSWESSTEESNRNAINFAKEVMQKSAERIMLRAQRLRTSRRTSETEETNRHELDNSKGDGHVTGIYRYVNKRYKAQVFNYGERLMFEFMIPEPSEFYKKTIENKNIVDTKVTFQCSKSLIPTLESKNILDKNGITQAVANEYASRLELKLDAYPYQNNVAKSDTIYLYAGKIETKWDLVGNNYDQPQAIKAITNQSNERDRIIFDMMAASPLTSKHQAQLSVKNIEVQRNAKLDIHAHIMGTAHDYHENNRQEQASVYLEVQEIPNSAVFVPCTGVWSVTDEHRKFQTIFANQNASITFKADCSWCPYYFIVVTIVQSEDENVIDSWKQKIYDELKSKIESTNKNIEALCQEEEKKFIAAQKQSNEQKIIKITGKNPEINKTIIIEELHKHAITLFAKEFDEEIDGDLLANNPIKYVAESIKRFKGATLENKKCVINELGVNCTLFPVINLKEAKEKGEVVQFLEQAFEWEKLSYVLYPYFYGDKSRWMETYDHFDNELNDLSFVAFLRAGYARVLVPVRDPYRNAVLQFLYTRKPWNGGSAPVIGDDLYLPIFEELRNKTDEYHDAVPEGESWEFVLPTSLIYLQQDSTLPTYDGQLQKENK